MTASPQRDSREEVVHMEIPNTASSINKANIIEGAHPLTSRSLEVRYGSSSAALTSIAACSGTAIVLFTIISFYIVFLRPKLRHPHRIGHDEGDENEDDLGHQGSRPGEVERTPLFRSFITWGKKAAQRDPPDVSIRRSFDALNSGPIRYNFDPRSTNRAVDAALPTHAAYLPQIVSRGASLRPRAFSDLSAVPLPASPDTSHGEVLSWLQKTNAQHPSRLAAQPVPLSSPSPTAFPLSRIRSKSLTSSRIKQKPAPIHIPPPTEGFPEGYSVLDPPISSVRPYSSRMSARYVRRDSDLMSLSGVEDDFWI